MIVKLAGFNVDHDVLQGAAQCAFVTPETLSAAYARISRSPKSVPELRQQALKEIEKARASNKKIIFGMGHHSVAEHAVFNFDIIGISRRAVEELEHHRLCSFTEKSQRYVTLDGDYVIPREIAKTSLKKDFDRVVALQNECYVHLYRKITEHNIKRHPQKARTRRDKRLLENLAKEDARYVLSLATEAQLGMTVNARNLELMIRRFASHPLHEMRELGNALYEMGARISPSLLLFCAMNDYDKKTYPTISRFTKRMGMRAGMTKKQNIVTLVHHSNNADDSILAALLFHTSSVPMTTCRRTVARMTQTQKQQLFKRACQHVELYDSVLREFEQAHLTFQLIVSAGCFGQLKRHRIATLICQRYDPHLGITLPESIVRVGMERQFRSIINDTEKVYYRIERKYPGIGSYILTNAHRRRVLLGVNLRELYHISRLREDPAAQWDIRHVSHEMTRLARKTIPICSQLLGGKAEYPKLYKSLFKRYPKVKHTPEP